MIFSTKNKYDSKDLDELADLQSIVKQVRLVKKLGKEGFHIDIKELFEPMTKAVTDSNQILLEETKFNREAIEALDESNDPLKALEILTKNGVIHSILIRPITKLLTPAKKITFDYIMILIVIIRMIWDEWNKSYNIR